MKTKLVYVLTCDPDKYYIEQAHISIFSARYHNPDATIVLIVDAETDTLFIGKRADLLQYITEKIVVNVPNNLSTMQKSRWLKTSVRNLLDGDFLFIDCDTVITQDLSEVDSWDCPIGAVLDTHRNVNNFAEWDKANLKRNSFICGWDFSMIQKYYSSGVLYVKDSIDTRSFYLMWHQLWEYCVSKEISIDQISLAKTNIIFPIINEISGLWNCIMFVRPSFVSQAKIIHFPSEDNNSFLFGNMALERIKNQGLTSYHKKYVLNPCHSFFPYNKNQFQGINLFHTLIWLSNASKEYAKNIDPNFSRISLSSCPKRIVPWLLKKGMYKTAIFIWIMNIIRKKNYNPIGRLYGEV